MNKTELIAEIAEKTGNNKKLTGEIVEAFLSTVTEQLTKQETIQLVGFGTFKTMSREARIGRNPKTKEEIKIPATKVPTFKAGKPLKDTVNG